MSYERRAHSPRPDPHATDRPPAGIRGPLRIRPTLALVDEQVPRMLLILKPKLRGFGDGQTVPSCNSCRGLLPMLLCEPASCSGSNAH
jgi:hypothetical protein